MINSVLYGGGGNNPFIIGENCNKSFRGNKKIKTHAEMNALQKLKRLITYGKIKNKKMDLIVLRATKNGMLCDSAPCYHCTQMLSINTCIRINNLYYSCGDNTITCIKFKDWVSMGTKHVSKGWKHLCSK